MKKTLWSAALAMMLLLVFVAAGLSIESGAKRTVTGNVIGVDDSGKGIAVVSGTGPQAMVAGAIVNDSTDIRIKGTKGDLTQIKPGDKVTMTYEYENNDLYAKKIMKK